jgi:hypothetical protein
MLRSLLGIAFASAVSALVGVDLLSWRRTAAVRTGKAPSAPVSIATSNLTSASSAGWPRGPLPSSPTTFLAATAGLAALGWGVAAVPSPRLGAILAILGGTFVAVVGLRSRVAAVDIEGAGLRVRYAARRSFFCSWSSIRSLHLPRTPLGPWRVVGLLGGVTLMPSDLLGHERALEAVVALAVLTFDGRSWRRGRPP